MLTSPQAHKTISPQTNGKIKRFRHASTKVWTLEESSPSRADLLAALPDWPHLYAHHGPRSAIGKSTITRLNNLAGHDA